MESMLLGALGLLLLLWVSYTKGKTKAKKENIQDILNAAKQAKEIRDTPTTADDDRRVLMEYKDK